MLNPCHTFEEAERVLLDAFRVNSWFIDQHWPENRQRVLLMAKDVLQKYPDRKAKIFEPGCGNGYISYLFACLGYSVTACDSWQLPERDEMFREAGVVYFDANLNHLDCFPSEADEKYEVVLFGEVFEHLLNYPIGVLEEINRVMKPGGLLILTTPNPSTLINGLRVIFDQYSPWGTVTFMSEPKIVNEKIIDRGDIHYREYRTAELVSALESAKLSTNLVRYLPVGAAKQQSLLKRFVKTVLASTQSRLFGTTQYLLANKAT